MAERSESMDRSSLVHGITVSVYLVVLTALLVVFLVRRQVPCQAILEIVEISILVFAASAGVSYRIAGRMVFDGGDSLLVYLPPVIPAAIAAVWLSRRAKSKRK